MSPGTLRNWLAVAGAALALSVSAGTSHPVTQEFGLISDDFNPETPHVSSAPAWEFYDPYDATEGQDAGESTLTFDGAHAVIAVPTGLSHDLWKVPGNKAPRLLQSVSDANFPVNGIEAKFETALSAQTQIQGIIVQQASDTFLRFDLFHDGSSPRLFVGFVSGSSTKVYLNTPVTAHAKYRRVHRTGSQWTYRYSFDGNTWIDAVTFSRTITVTKVGVFVGNNTASPGVLSSVDYVINLDAPISDSDAWSPPPPVIDVWYGSPQSFGAGGHPQRWVNILGNVTSDVEVSSLTYSVNGASDQPLVMGPDKTSTKGIGGRLVWKGDFNIEIDQATLNTGPNAVHIKAQDSRGNLSSRIVTVNYSSGQVFALPYTVDWGTLKSIAEAQDVSSFVDGLWGLTPAGIRTIQTGYDRAIAVGDQTWSTDYEVVVPVTTHSSFLGAGVAVGWQGHEDRGGGLPSTGWPLQAMAWIRGPLGNSNLDIMTYGEAPKWEVVVARTPIVTAANVVYMLKVRSEPRAAGTSRVLVKFWPRESAEPAVWTLHADVPTRNGSVLLVAYNGDVTFGAVSVAAVTGTAFPPSITTEPSDQSVVEGQAATFSVAASGSGPLAYQWQRNGTDIPEANGPSYTTPASMFSEDGAAFRCIVSNSAGSAVSEAAVLTVVANTPSSLRSDDFNPTTTELNPVWRFHDPYNTTGATDSGESILTFDGTNAVIDIPAGLSHDLWAGKSLAPRLLQPAGNENFGIEVKFESAPSMRYQLQGIVVQQDDDTFLRFDTYHDGTSPRLFVAYVDGTTSTVVRSTVLPSVPPYRQVLRSGTQWTYRYSYDGSTWTDGATFTQAVAVTEVGVFGGTNKPNPSFVVKLDYFMNMAAPLVDNDTRN